jgi:hypothetical protein
VTIEAFCVDYDEEDINGGPGCDKPKPDAGDGGGHGGAGGAGETAIANEQVREKIRKMLKLGLHPDTPDSEAQQALKNANRFLTRYNLQQVSEAAD